MIPVVPAPAAPPVSFSAAVDGGMGLGLGLSPVSDSMNLTDYDAAQQSLL